MAVHDHYEELSTKMHEMGQTFKQLPFNLWARDPNRDSDDYERFARVAEDLKPRAPGSPSGSLPPSRASSPGSRGEGRPSVGGGSLSLSLAREGGSLRETPARAA